MKKMISAKELIMEVLVIIIGYTKVCAARSFVSRGRSSDRGCNNAESILMGRLM